MQVLVIDDHALFREGLRLLITSLDDEFVIHEAESCEAGLALAKARELDLILLDLNLPGKNHLEALDTVREAVPETPVVVLSGEENPAIIKDAIRAGAMGFIPKSSNQQILIQAVRLVIAGGIYLPPLAMEESRPANHTSEASTPLSPRQLEVLRLVVEGKSNKMIADNLHISESTVKSHVSAVMQILGANNRTEAVYRAASLNLQL